MSCCRRYDRSPSTYLGAIDLNRSIRQPLCVRVPAAARGTTLGIGSTLAMAAALVISGPLTLAASSIAAPVPAPAASAPAASSAADLLPMVVSTQLWVGDNDLILDLLDPDGVRLDDAELAATVRLTVPDGRTGAEYPLERIRLASTGRDVYRARVTFDAVGERGLSVTAHTGDGQTRTGSANVQVLDDVGTPGLGTVVVPIDTPTLKSSGYDLASITSDPDPLPQLYWTSVREALDAGRAFMLVIDTVGLGVNSACGSGVGEARQMPSAFPGLLVIHAEPFVTQVVDGVLARDPIDGPPRIAPWAAAWGVTEPPWIFVVDGDGVLRAKFQGVFGTDELLSALRQVAPYAPGGH